MHSESPWTINYSQRQFMPCHHQVVAPPSVYTGGAINSLHLCSFSTACHTQEHTTTDLCSQISSLGFETNHDIASYNYIISSLKADHAMLAFLLSFCSESFYHCSVWLLGSMLQLLANYTCSYKQKQPTTLLYNTIQQAYNKLQANYKQIATHYIQAASEHVITFVPWFAQGRYLLQYKRRLYCKR